MYVKFKLYYESTTDVAQKHGMFLSLSRRKNARMKLFRSIICFFLHFIVRKRQSSFVSPLHFFSVSSILFIHYYYQTFNLDFYIVVIIFSIFFCIPFSLPSFLFGFDSYKVSMAKKKSLTVFDVIGC